MSRVLRSATPWMLAVLLAIAVYAYMRAEHHADRADAIQANLVRAEQRADILLEQHRCQRRQIETMTAVMQVRDERMERDFHIINQLRHTARDREPAEAGTDECAH